VPVGAQQDTAFLGKFDGVAEQVKQHLADTHLVAENPMGQRRVDIDMKAQAFLIGIDGQG